MTVSRETVADLLRQAAAALGAAGSETPRLDAEVLLCAVLGRNRAWLIGHRDDCPPREEVERFQGFVARRTGREPVSRILNSREFFGLDFALDAEALDPRPDSETLVEVALALMADRRMDPLRVLDLGTGSGCLLLALLSALPSAWGLGLDRAWGAARCARDNARALGLGPRSTFAVGSWTAALSGRFDLVVSNPPYIPTSAIAGLAPEVRTFDPRAALDGGPDGLDPYRRIVPALPSLLAPGAVVVLEHGMGQGADIAPLLVGNGLIQVQHHPDLAGIGRCVSARAL
ncbi:peptide chain release factor N(5)-glutamine methyltransferase [Zavarzinia sp. CC-PAN008]|uniref:peptide chain release factor N(5)-glutamine methyltransferase n=1 Tax=Zavarzinia sp. CC-PAN008 TaxID=3243332 RepID=UPI003F74321B